MNMYRQAQHETRSHRQSWSRLRVRLGLAILLAAVLPGAFLLYIEPLTGDAPIIATTTIGMLVATLLSYYLLRNMSTFPGVRASSFIMPSTLIGYGAVLFVFFFGRLDYSRSIFLSSFTISLIWFYASGFLLARSGRLRIGIVPFGNVDSLTEIKDVAWGWLTTKSLTIGRFDALVADLRADLPDEWEAFIAESAINGTIVFHVKQLRESLTGKVEIEHLSENSFGSLVPFMAYLKAKRVLDLLSAAAAAVLLLPVLLIVALLIRLDSPGPALFRQKRMGYRGQEFWVAKFRTMSHVRSEECEFDGAITTAGDNRVTRLGRYLRRTRIDELPQILNILRGEMSWIGPRPEAAVLSNWYETELPFYRYRHIVLPGITGWAQVNQGHVADLENVKFKLHYDFYYIKNFSPWLDALIFLKTVRTVLTGFGAR